MGLYTSHIIEDRLITHTISTSGEDDSMRDIVSPTPIELGGNSMGLGVRG
jgi:hypothetical protein